jgi:hypothetical protein
MNKLILLFAVAMLTNMAMAQDTEVKRYLTPPDYAQDVYFGDSHIHTEISVDAALWGNKLSPEDTYKYVRGGEVTTRPRECRKRV